MAQGSMSFEEEVDILTWYFNLIGLPFHRTKRGSGYASTAKQWLKFLSECFFYAFGAYVAYNSVVGTPYHSWFIKLTTCSMSVLVVVLRVAVCTKRAKILEVLSEIGRFAETCRSPPKLLSMRREIRLICWVNVAFPLTSSFVFMILMVGSYEEVKHQLKPDLVTMCGGSSACTVASIFVISAGYAFNFFVVPSLCMMLFFFVYVRYECALAQTLCETHRQLTSDLSFESIERSVLGAVWLGFMAQGPYKDIPRQTQD